MQLNLEEKHLNQIMYQFKKPEFDETQTVLPQRSRDESQPPPPATPSGGFNRRVALFLAGVLGTYQELRPRRKRWLHNVFILHLGGVED